MRTRSPIFKIVRVRRFLDLHPVELVRVRREMTDSCQVPDGFEVYLQ
jgi:AcrR family transcriptional regulator